MKLVLIDGNSILNRTYYAIPPLNDNEGVNVNAVYGFVNILFKVFELYQPTHIIVAFDKRGKSFRKELYAEYKANRKGMPDDLAAQMPILKDLLTTMNIKYIDSDGVEADDIIGTISKAYDEETVIVSGDRDLFQLIDDNTIMLMTKRGITEVETVSLESLKSNYKMSPSQVVDYKSLCGDASDNIPGVAGVGDKTALSLIEKYGNLDNIYLHIDEIGGSIATRLKNNKDMAYLSHKLATIKTDYSELVCQLEDCILKPFNYAVVKAFEKLQFRSLVKKLNLVENQAEDNPIKNLVVEQVVVEEDKQLVDIVDKLLKSKKVAIHFSDSIYLSSQEDKEYKVLISDNFLQGMSFETAINVLSKLLVGDCEKIVYDGKAIRHFLQQFNCEIKNIKYDLSIMQYLVEYRAYKDISSLLEHYGVTNFAAGQFAVANMLNQQLDKDDMRSLYCDIELPLSRVLYDMEVEGVKVDVAMLDELNAKMTAEIEQLSNEVYQLVGFEFNISSPKQLGVVLFEKLNLPSGKKTKTGFSTDADVLEKLLDAHPIVPLVIKIRQLSKLNGTYLEGLKPLIKAGDHIHTTYNQTLTSTGRLSSSEPNLQNLPVRDDVGKELRKMFIPRYDVLISADYSQIELRLLAHFSQDEALINAFNSGVDIHSLVASELFGIPQEMVNSNMRRMAKAVNFGIIYGISEYGLSQNVGISPSKAKEYIAKYFATYPKIKDYLHSSIDFARENGYVTTITGRRRQIPEIKSSNFQLRSFGERAAMNMPLQGSAADVIKIAMLKVDKQLKAQKCKSKLIMQVHDELIVDTVLSEVEQVVEILKNEMTSAVNTRVKLDVNVSVGANLYEAK